MSETRYFCGIDVGSSATKAVLLNSLGDICDKEVVQQGVGSSDTRELLDRLYGRHDDLSEENVLAVATGYGRMNCKEAAFQKSEISCHAKGVKGLIPEAGTIIDIGGQDSKVIRVSDTGVIEEFVMNDKCAAGTGRFLDVMSHVLAIPLPELGTYDARSENALTISNTCTVFAESEVISCLSRGEKIEDIVAGIHNSVASKVASLAKRIGIKDSVVLTGGVAQNSGIVRALERELGRPIVIPHIPQFTGALGAARYALEESKL